MFWVIHSCWSCGQTQRIFFYDNFIIWNEKSLNFHIIKLWLVNFFVVLCMQILQSVDKSDTKHEHPLAALAEEAKKLLKKDSTLFVPILSTRHPHAIVVSASLLHRFYGVKLVSTYLVIAVFLKWHISFILSALVEGTFDIWSFKFQKPFLDGAEHLTEDVVSVFPAADSLEQYIMALILSACEDETPELFYKKLTPYQVSDLIRNLLHTQVSGPL